MRFLRTIFVQNIAYRYLSTICRLNVMPRFLLLLQTITLKLYV